jgi:hypothetical protein
MTASDPQQQIAMLTILLATCETCLRSFKAANNSVDERLVVDLERMVERSGRELEALVERGRSRDPA